MPAGGKDIQMRPTRFYSKKQESAIADVTGGRRTANSGATKFDKGDVVAGQWLLEAKTVMKEQKTFTIKKEWLEKNKEEAFAIGKEYNALVFDFGDNGKRYYVIDEKIFLLVKEALENDK